MDGKAEFSLPMVHIDGFDFVEYPVEDESQYEDLRWNEAYITITDVLGVQTRFLVRVFNDHGEILIEAKVTDRIMPGVGAIPQGMWHDADMDGDRVDKGGCINTLTSRHCTPVAKATGQHTIIGQIAKA